MMGTRKGPKPSTSTVDVQRVLDAEDKALHWQKLSPLACRRFLLETEIADLKRRLKKAQDDLKHVNWDMCLLLAKIKHLDSGTPGT
jgi:hypothetical protein